jgi:hypothetical protein
MQVVALTCVVLWGLLRWTWGMCCMHLTCWKTHRWVDHRGCAHLSQAGACCMWLMLINTPLSVLEGPSLHICAV